MEVPKSLNSSRVPRSHKRGWGLGDIGVSGSGYIEVLAL